MLHRLLPRAHAPILTGLIFLTAPPAFLAAAPAPDECVKVRRGSLRAVLEADGTFVPAEAVEVTVTPRAFKGEFRIAEVAPHGSQVKEGDVVLKIDSEDLESAIKDAGWSLRSSELALADLKLRHAEMEADAERDLSRAEKDLEFATRALHGYLEISRPLTKEEQAQSERNIRHSIADQEEEIAQLGKMYKEDELTEETEEIVLKRAQRNLEETKKRLDFVQRRNRYGEEFTEPPQREALENAVKDKEKALRDLRRARASARKQADIELERKEHDLALARRRAERLGEDLERFTARAPYDGIVIHGAFAEKLAVEPLRKGGAVLANRPLLAIARPGALKARFTLKEKDRHRVRGGMSVAIVPEAAPEARLAGSLEPVAGFPLADNTWNAHALFAHEDQRLLPLLKCKVTVVLGEHDNALLVPAKAVTWKDGRALAYVRGESPLGVVARAVTTGITDGTWTVVLDGLKEGDEVLVGERAGP